MHTHTLGDAAHCCVSPLDEYSAPPRIVWKLVEEEEYDEGEDAAAGKARRSES